ncbi:MAG: pyridoxal kinase PdxY [Acetobacteraceae bacterium]|nr:pyridoxal kinase PdxY [Acetobacteraceae bacterium]
MNILSIQSWVAYGHVGNAAAIFPLQRLGAEVWGIHTVQFSNHTGYGAWTGDVFTGPAIRALVDGIESRGVLPRCDAVLSGYIGDATVGQAILHAVHRVRTANPRALYCCDPVIGDHNGGVYVRPGIPEFLLRDALPAADIATPNSYELQHLTDLPCKTLHEAKAAVLALATRLHSPGPRIVLVTGLRTAETPSDSLDMLTFEDGSFHLLRTPALDLHLNGAGDVIAALFVFHRLHLGAAAPALQAAGSSLHGILCHTAQAGAPEPELIAAQQELVAPSITFVPIQV